MELPDSSQYSSQSATQRSQHPVRPAATAQTHSFRGRADWPFTGWLCFWGILVCLATAARGSPRRRCWDGGCRTRRCGRAATSGSLLGCSRWSRPKRSLPMTGSWDSISMTCASTGPPTRRPAAATAPAKALWTGENSAESGRSRQTGRGSRSGGLPAARTATTSCCSTPPLPRSNDKGSITTPRPCIWTADTGEHASTGQPPLGLRWRVERTDSWLSNYGKLRRNTDRRTEHRLAQLALAVTLIIANKLIDHRNRWQPHNCPIR